MSSLIVLSVMVLAPPTPPAVVERLQALHADLRNLPYDRRLQRELQAIRESLPYPEGTRPPPPRGIRATLSPWDVFGIAALAGTLLTVGLAIGLTNRRPGWQVALAIGGSGLALAGYLHDRVDTPEHRIWLIVTRTSILRMGNSDIYPARIPDPLPVGAEVEFHHQRGAWVQVKLPGEILGWLPVKNLVIVPPE